MDYLTFLTDLEKDLPELALWLVGLAIFYRMMIKWAEPEPIEVVLAYLNRFVRN